MEHRYLISILFVLLGVKTFAQTAVIDSCDYVNGFCGSSFRTYSDSTFILMQGCEMRQNIQIGTFYSEGDTTVLRRIPLHYENFIDSIVFVQSDTAVDTIDVFYFDKTNQSIWTSNDMVAGLDSAYAWSTIKTGDGIHKHYEGIYEMDRSYNYFVQNDSIMPQSNRYKHCSTYIVQNQVPLGLILHDLYLWTGENKVIALPENTREVYVYHTLPKKIIYQLLDFSTRVNQPIGYDQFTCQEKVFRFE